MAQSRPSSINLRVVTIRFRLEAGSFLSPEPVVADCYNIFNGTSMSDQTSQLEFDPEIAAHLRRDNQVALAVYFDRYRPRLKASLPQNERLSRRVADSDILQNTYIEATRLLPDYIENPRVPLYVWLRQICHRMMSRAQRYHYEAEKRTVAREDSLIESSVLAKMSDDLTSPSSMLNSSEQTVRLHKLLDSMPEKYRDILILKHVEQFSLKDAAVRLGITADSARQRHFRALKFLQEAAGVYLD